MYTADIFNAGYVPVEVTSFADIQYRASPFRVPVCAGESVAVYASIPESHVIDTCKTALSAVLSEEIAR